MSTLKVVEAKNIQVGDQLVVNSEAFGAVRVKEVRSVSCSPSTKDPYQQFFYFILEDAFTVTTARFERLLIVVD